ncbi:MAG: DUF1320 family protein [Bacteroidetes bacterium]|nr:DUF1320 family protein [Bacteroidota bacterium]
MYVTKGDYKSKISVELLDILLAEDENGILAMSSKTAEDTIATTAGVLYNVADEFTKTTTARNYYLLNLAIDIALYNIYQRSDDEQVPEKVIKNHDDALEALQKISIGKQALNLPPPTVNVNVTVNNGDGSETVTTGGTGLRRIGSQPKRTHNI